MTPSSPSSLSNGQSWILSIETSHRIGGVALCLAPTAGESGTLAHSTIVDMPAAKNLLPSIAAILESNHVGREQLVAVAVTAGPGSFTGCRIGVTAAKSIAYSLGIATIGVNTLDAIAEARRDVEAPRMWVALDAQRGDLFVAKYPSLWERNPEDSDPTRLVSTPEWLAQLVAGDLVVAPAAIGPTLPSGVAFSELPPSFEVAEGVGRLAWKALKQGQTTSPFELLPRYYRESAAEEKRRLT